MKINLYFNLEKSRIPKDYHKYIISFIKYCLSKYDNELYEEWYTKNNTTVKNFTFGVYMYQPEFKEDYIEIKNKRLTVYFKMPLGEQAIRLKNAITLKLQNEPEFKISNNTLRITKIYSETIKEFDDTELIIKTNSPIIARNHIKITNENKYYLATDKEFEETLKMNINNIIKELNLEIDASGFKITPLKTTDTVVSLYETSIPVSLGIFKIEGNKKLLNFLYQAGLGSLRSSGFGSFSIIK